MSMVVKRSVLNIWKLYAGSVRSFLPTVSPSGGWANSISGWKFCLCARQLARQRQNSAATWRMGIHNPYINYYSCPACWMLSLTFHGPGVIVHCNLFSFLVLNVTVLCWWLIKFSLWSVQIIFHEIHGVTRWLVICVLYLMCCKVLQYNCLFVFFPSKCNVLRSHRWP